MITIDANGIIHENDKKYRIESKCTELVLPEGCPKEGNVVLGKNNLLIFAQNGNVYVNGKLVTNDEEIVDGMREFLRSFMSR